jgi:hypothetical protein
VAAIGGAVVVAAGCVALASSVGGPTVSGQLVRATVHQGSTTPKPAVHRTSSVAPAAATGVPVTPIPPVTATTSTTVVAATPVLPTVATLVAQAEAAGIDPATGWSWSMGATSAGCGAIGGNGGNGAATGCTSWSSGSIRTVFSGSPTLRLVAHEVANAEVEADADPALLARVALAAGSSSWSSTDAVASCLVLHAFGWQDGAAGPWQCPTSLADYVAAHIHDTVTTMTTTAVCGAASGISSTLSFQAGAGTLTVTGPSGSPAQVVGAGGTLTSSGVGTFTAVDVGATPVVTGVCEG